MIKRLHRCLVELDAKELELLRHPVGGHEEALMKLLDERESVTEKLAHFERLAASRERRD